MTDTEKIESSGLHLCECSSHGFCPARGCDISRGLWKECQAGHFDMVSQLSAQLAKPRVEVAVPPRPAFDDKHQFPGSVLHDLLRSRHGVTIASCKCQEWIDKMNAWGPDGCRENLETIVDHLFEEASTNTQVSAAVRMSLQVPLIGKFEGRRRITALVNEAIAMAETAPHRNMSQSELAVRLQSPAVNWPKGWHDWPNVIEFHASLVQSEISNLKSEIKTHKSKIENPSRAILIPAGGLCRIYDKQNPQPYFWAAYAAAYTLRAHGCVLPIEFWFLPGEMDAIEHCELHARRVAATCRVLDTAGMRVAHGWQVKINAILQSEYDQVLHLDSDNIVTRDPSFLFDCAEFAENAAMFWGDNPGLKDHRGYVGPKQWSRLGSHRTDTVRDIEAGQMLIDKTRSGAALQMVKLLADHADYFGGYNGGDPGIWYGDKTDFHVGFALTETRHWINQGFKWNGGGFYEHNGPDGRLLFQHACHKKGHLVNGHRIQNLQGNDLLYESSRFRAPHTWLDGSVEDAQRLISPEKCFEIPDDRGVSREVWLDVVSRNEYRLPQSFQPHEVIIDIGANSGAFSYACLRRGAGKVIACEPFPESVSRLRRNCKASGRASALHVVEAAVWRSDIRPETLTIATHESDSRTTSYSSVLGSQKRNAVAVPAMPLDSLLIECGSVHILKLDCEGAEFPILYTSKELRRCEHILGEYHADARPELAGDSPVGGWPAWSLAGLCDFLRSQGFAITAIEENSKVHGGFWAARV